MVPSGSLTKDAFLVHHLRRAQQEKGGFEAPKLQGFLVIPFLVISNYSLLYLIRYSKFYIFLLKRKPKSSMADHPQVSLQTTLRKMPTT